jgi:hypothetical protein
MVVARNRMNLGFAPEAAKRTRKNDAVMVFVKGAATEFFRTVQRFSKAFTGKQGVPIQGWFSPSGD